MTQPELIIKREDNGKSGRYVTTLDGGPEAQMTYRWTGEKTIAIDHTGVPEAYRGKGIAQKLVEQGIADARAEGTNITPICSYVVAQFRRNPDWSDVRAKA